MKPIQRALISVSDKTGVVEFASALHALGIEIISTGGTAKLLRSAGLPIVEVGDYTGFPEMMDGRLKTLHPRVHGGLLGRRGIDDQVMAEHNIPPIDLVAVNLYPFEQTIERPDSSFTLAIENIDIGGPAMLRAAAKNHQSVTVIVDATDYATVLQEMRGNHNAVSEATRLLLATKTFEHTARYDGLIATYLGSLKNGRPDTAFPRTFNRQFTKIQELRYGENPHQKAAFYRETRSASDAIVNARQVQGKELSFNNIVDADMALECVKQFTDGPVCCVIVKHANPCGVACADTLPAAYENAYRGDPESAFGGIIAFNRELDEITARAIIDRQFVEVIIAPDASQNAIAALRSKKNVRLLLCGELQNDGVTQLDFKRISGGLLIQDSDSGVYEHLKVVSQKQPSAQEIDDLLFSWKVAKFVKSNAIVYAHNRQTVGIGAGQMSRVNSARIAAIKAEQVGLQVAGSVMASDAFFPFRDGIDAAAAVGICAIIQPGGSMRDEEVIKAADEHGMAMIFTGMRHFRH